MDAISTANSITASSSAAGSQLSANYEMFLDLLTAELRNQDPLEPMDSSEWVNQLVQFSGVEQQIQTNDAIADLVSITANSTAAAMSGYLGKDVLINSPAIEYSNGDVVWEYQPGSETTETTLEVRDSDGNIVYSESGETTSATHQFQWNGLDSDGNPVSEGFYSLSAITKNADGEEARAPVGVRARVTGVDLSQGETGISTNVGTYNFSEVLSFSEPGSEF